MAEKKTAMANAYKAQMQKYGTPITKEQYIELRRYANDHGLLLSGFKNYVGDIDIINVVIDDISDIAKDFPLILEEKNRVQLILDFDMSDGDFATTDSGHWIHLNAEYFMNLDKLKNSYAEGERIGRFVKNTNWRSVVRHETGHVVANIYHIDVIGLTKRTLGITNRLDILARLRKELSIYSAEYYDCREVISECFSGYYSKAGNALADSFVTMCIEAIQ